MSKVLALDALALVVRGINDLAEAGKWEDVPALINGILASHNALHDENARLREALAWYADPENWEAEVDGVRVCGEWDDEVDESEDERYRFDFDYGDRARAALAGEDTA